MGILDRRQQEKLDEYRISGNRAGRDSSSYRLSGWPNSYANIELGAKLDVQSPLDKSINHVQIRVMSAFLPY